MVRRDYWLCRRLCVGREEILGSCARSARKLLELRRCWNTWLESGVKTLLEYLVLRDKTLLEYLA